MTEPDTAKGEANEAVWPSSRAPPRGWLVPFRGAREATTQRCIAAAVDQSSRANSGEVKEAAAAVDQSSRANSGKVKEAATGSKYPDLRAQAGEGSRFQVLSKKPAMGRGCSEIAPKPLP